MQSWIESANRQGCDFPIQNLPYGVFSRAGEAPRCGVAIGDSVLDLAPLEAAEILGTGRDRRIFDKPALNDFMALGSAAWSKVREQLTEVLREGGDPTLRDDATLRDKVLIPLSEAKPHLPFAVAEYTDFYAGRQHAFNVGSMFRGPENALPPNWLHIPIGYNGRASTVVVSGTDIHRPRGQIKPHDAEEPSFSPSRRLDFELEMGAVVGTSTEMGHPITVDEADEMIFGYVLLNDWSARDIQAWEYQPLGPFQAKAFGTSISPWVVTRAALEPFRIATPAREVPLVPYLVDSGPMLYDIELSVSLQPEGAARATEISRSSYRHIYYSAAQQLAHHAISGCRMRTGDLLGSGTISGPEKHEFGSLLELSWGGKEPLMLESGETRSFLEDGDTVTLWGWAASKDYRIGFGDCSGKVLPALPERNWSE